MAFSDIIARLAVEMSMDTAAFEKGATLAEKRMEQSRKKFEALGKRMSKVGKTMSLAVTAPLVAIGVKAVQGAQEQAAAMAQVEAALKSMGAVSGKTSGELAKTADALEMRSLYNADVILKEVTANLLTFGNVAGEQFDRAQQAAVDMATRLGTAPQSAAIMLGKALNDPIKGITALTRVGVQFTEQQKATIKAMVAVGDTAGAQGIILAEVERQFAGAAQAAADATPWRKAQVAIDQAMDKIGEAILPVIPQITAAIVAVAGAFASLSPEMQKTIVVGGVLAAALGPVLVALGGLIQISAPMLAFTKALFGLSAAQTTVAAGAKVAAVGFGSLAASLLPIAGLALGAYLVWKNWDDIAPRLQPLIDQLSAIGEGLGLVEGKAGRTSSELAKDEGFRTFGEKVAGAAGKIQAFLDAGDAFSERFAATMREFYGSLDRFDQQVKSAVTSVIASMGRMVGGIRSWVVDKLNAVWSTVKAKVEQVKGYFFSLYDAVVGNSYVPDMVDGIAAHMKRLDSVMVAQAGKVTDATAEKFQNLRTLLDRLFPEQRAIIDFRADLSTLKEQLSGPELEEAVKRLNREFGGVPLTGSGLDNPDVDMSAGELGTEGAARFEERWSRVLDTINDKIAEGKSRWGQFQEAAAYAYEELSYQLKGVILGAQSLGDALRNVVARLADMALSAAFKSLGTAFGIPAFAGGTNYAPGGLALVGERGPELVNLPRGSQVIPNHELRGMNGGQTVHSPTFVFPGISNERMAREAGSQAALRYRQMLNGPVRA